MDYTLDQTTVDYIDRLTEFYKDDKEAMATIAGWFRSVKNTNELAIFREHPQAKRLIAECLTRASQACSKLLQVELTEKDRIFYLVSLDWSSWFLDSLGEDPKRSVEQIQNIVKGYAVRAGIASKEE